MGDDIDIELVLWVSGSFHLSRKMSLLNNILDTDDVSAVFMEMSWPYRIFLKFQMMESSCLMISDCMIDQKIIRDTDTARGQWDMSKDETQGYKNIMQ